MQEERGLEGVSSVMAVDKLSSAMHISTHLLSATFVRGKHIEDPQGLPLWRDERRGFLGDGVRRIWGQE